MHDGGTGSEFRTSSYTSGGNCVEVADLSDGVVVRDSHHPGRSITVGTTEWTAFLSGLRHSGFTAD